MHTRYLVFNVSQSVYPAWTGIGVGSSYTVTFHDTFQSAQEKAKSLAQTGTIGVIFGTIEVHRKETPPPPPIIIERIGFEDSGDSK